MAVDAQNRYLATGDVDGTVKVWDIREYCLHQQDEVVTVPPSKCGHNNHCIHHTNID